MDSDTLEISRSLVDSSESESDSEEVVLSSELVLVTTVTSGVSEVDVEDSEVLSSSDVSVEVSVEVSVVLSDLSIQPICF